MKTFKTALLITGILVAGLAFNSVAQTTEKNAPLEELYSYKHDKHKHKSDKHKAKVKPHAKHNKIHKNKSKRLLKAKARLNNEREI